MVPDNTTFYSGNSSVLQNASGSGLGIVTFSGLSLLTVLTPIYWTLALVIMIINGVLLLLFFRCKTVRLSLNYFVVSQIVTDIQVGLITVPLVLLFPRQRLILNTDFSDGVCVLIMVCQTTIPTIMPWGLTLSAVDRLVAVLRPTTYKFIITKTRSATAIFLLWIFILLFNSFPAMNIAPSSGDNIKLYCSGKYRYPVSYLHTFVILLFAAPFTLTAFCYISMYLIINRKNKVSSLNTDSEIHPSFKKAVKATKTCLISTGLVTLGWFPYLAFLAIFPILEGASPVVTFYSFCISFLTAVAVSAINPLVYLLRSDTIKTAFTNIFLRRDLESQETTITVLQTPTVSSRLQNDGALNNTGTGISLQIWRENNGTPNERRLVPRPSRIER